MTPHGAGTATDAQPALSHEAILRLADELRRLALIVSRDIRRNATLPALSGLTAMRPLQGMLAQSLSSAVLAVAGEPDEMVTADSNDPQPGTSPGYL